MHDITKMISKPAYYVCSWGN